MRKPFFGWNLNLSFICGRKVPLDPQEQAISGIKNTKNPRKKTSKTEKKSKP